MEARAAIKIGRLRDELYDLKKFRNKNANVPTFNAGPRSTLDMYYEAAHAAAEAATEGVTSEDESPSSGASGTSGSESWSSSGGSESEGEESAVGEKSRRRRRKRRKRRTEKQAEKTEKKKKTKRRKNKLENNGDPQQMEPRGSVHNAEQALLAAETIVRQKLSPVALRTMGAFAKYAHEEQTGAFTLKDKKDLMRRTAKHNWKIAKFLFRKRKGGEVEELHADGKEAGKKGPVVRVDFVVVVVAVVVVGVYLLAHSFFAKNPFTRNCNTTIIVHPVRPVSLH